MEGLAVHPALPRHGHVGVGEMAGEIDRFHHQFDAWTQRAGEAGQRGGAEAGHGALGNCRSDGHRKSLAE